MRRNSRVDENQKLIVSTFRRLGASVLHTSNLKNCFDILVGFKGVNYIVEIKDGLKPPSQKKLTKGEEKFMNEWKGGKYFIVESVDDVYKILKIN